MSVTINVAVIYYSATGTLFDLAKAAATAAEKAGADIRLRKVAELAPDEAIASNAGWEEHLAATQHVKTASLDDLAWADAFMLGAPTRYGLPASQMKQFMDTTGPLWSEGRLVNKVASSFSASATRHGGQESTILAMNNVFYHWGCIIVPPGYADPSQFESGNPYGASHTSANGEIPPGDLELEAAKFQARRVVQVAQMLVTGRAALGGVEG